MRQSVSLPADVAQHVRAMAKDKRQSANRVILDLIEEGIEAKKRKQGEFMILAERFRASSDDAEVKQLGDELGRMIFGG